MDSENKRETKHLESTPRLKAIIDTAIDGIITIDAHGIIETVNPAVAKIFGYNPEEIIGQNVKMLMPEPDRSQHDQYLENYHSTGIRKIIGIGREVKGRKKDGTVFPFLLSVSEVQLEHKKIYTGIIHDISQLKDTQAALAESEGRMNAIVNAAVDGIITINERGVIEIVNPAASRLFGYSPEEMIGHNIRFLMPEPDSSRHDQYLEDYLHTGVRKIIGIGREVTALRKDGTTFPIYLSISELQLSGRRIFTGFVYDITEQKNSEEKLRRYAAELERSNAELQDFAYVSSHDLQEPLRKIQAFGDLLLSDELKNLSEEGQDFLNRIINAASRMQMLINDLLNYSRVTTKAQPFVKVDLNKVLREVLSDLEISIQKSEAVIESATLPIVEADSTQMRQLFQNLISNAIKFRKENQKPFIKISATTISKNPRLQTPGNEMVELRFADNGIGFDQQYVDRIFNIFQRLEGQKYEGSGIGLSVCRKIATRHGGSISAESEVGKGSVFIVTLGMKQPQNV